jgi:hypothetical protein
VIWKNLINDDITNVNQHGGVNIKYTCVSRIARACAKTCDYGIKTDIFSRCISMILI